MDGMKLTSDLVPNWNEQHAIDYMAWQIDKNGMSATAVSTTTQPRGIQRQTGRKMVCWKRHQGQGQSIP